MLVRKTIVGVSVLLVLGIADGWRHHVDASAMYARSLSLPCAQCHTIAPDLNEFGAAFRARGNRLTGLEDRLPESERAADGVESPAAAAWPFSVRAIGGYGYRSRDHQDTDQGESKLKTRTAGLERVTVTSGGMLTPTVGYYVSYRPPLSNTPLAASETQEGDLEFAWIRFNDVLTWASTVAHVKVGAFELDHLVSHQLRATLSSYPIYAHIPYGSAVADDPEAALDLHAPQLGAEVSVQGLGETSLALAVTTGTNTAPDTNTALDFYLRGSFPWKNRSLGAFGYWGSASTNRKFTSTGEPITGSGYADQPFYRYGIDASLHVAPLRVALVVLSGTDSSGLFGGSAPNTASYQGGFLEMHYDDCLFESMGIICTLRYDMIRSAEQGDAATNPKYGDFDGVTLALRRQIVTTSRAAMVVHGEYSHTKTKAVSVDGNDQNDNRITLALDVML